MGLFRKNAQGLIEIDKAEVQLVYSFNKILRRDRGSKGDVDGRKKFFAFKELGYVYWIADYTSPGNKEGLNEEELHEQAVGNFKLPNNWKPDEVVEEAIEWYRRDQETESLGALMTMRRSLKITQKAVNKLQGRIERAVDRMAEAEESNQANSDSIDIMVNDVNALLNINTKITSAVKELDLLIPKVQKEQTGKRKSKGGKEVGNRADPEDRKFK